MGAVSGRLDQPVTSPLILPRRVPVAEIADPVGLLRSAGITMSEEAERLVALEEARYVLVRMDQGERWRCRECGGKHHFLTLFCTPRPWRGLRHGLSAYYQNIGSKLSDLSPAERSQVDGVADGVPNLADRHPRAAQALGTAPSDVDYVGWLLGTVEVISEFEARSFAATINSKARRTVVRL